MAWQDFDADYISRLVAADPSVEQHFSDYFGDLLMIKLRSRIRPPQLREDLIQETFLRVFGFLRKTGGLDHPERLGAFVNTVCNNVLMEHFRSLKKHTDSPSFEADPPDQSASSESKLVTEERKQRVRLVLRTLPEKDQRILTLLFLEEVDKNEICRQMQVDRQYLRVLVHRAKARFRDGFLRGQTAAMAMWL
jgi:RNA polymerase sigma-70 factor (ECF subfamily)